MTGENLLSIRHDSRIRLKAYADEGPVHARTGYQ